MTSLPTLSGHAQRLDERTGFVGREIGQLDPVSDVERRARGILDQVARRGDADEHERQALQSGIGGTILVQEADCRKEIVGEVQPQRRVDLVDEHHEPLAPFRQALLPADTA